MYQFVGKVKVFNGRFWREQDVRVKASTIQAATAAATRQGVADAKKRFKIRSVEAVAVTIERLGRIDSPAALDARDAADAQDYAATSGESVVD